MKICAYTDWWFTNIGIFLECHEGAIEAVATVVIAAFTIILAISTNRLWKETKAGSKTAKIAAQATSRIAKRTAENAALWQTSFRQQMRAFVSIRNMRVERRPGPDGERRFYFLFDWVNTGNTPTKNMKTYVQFYLEDQPIPEDFDFSGPLGVKETGTAFIAPKVQYQVPTCPQWELHRRNCINMPLSGAGRLMKMYSLQPQFTLPGFAV